MPGTITAWSIYGVRLQAENLDALEANPRAPGMCGPLGAEQTGTRNTLDWQGGSLSRCAALNGCDTCCKELTRAVKSPLSRGFRGNVAVRGSHVMVPYAKTLSINPHKVQCPFWLVYLGPPKDPNYAISLFSSLRG